MDTLSFLILTLLLTPAVVTAVLVWLAVRSAEHELAEFEGL